MNRKYFAMLLAGVGIIPASVGAEEVQSVYGVSNIEGVAEIVVFGRGETRQVQEIGASDVAILAAGTSPLKAIEKLPGVNFQSADAFGNYEWSQRISIRSFNQNQIGFTFDGVPLGDGAYGNYNGLHISRAIISENVGSVQVSQGAGSIGTQATNNLGGTIENFSSDPAGQFGLRANVTAGSADTLRIYTRADLGTRDGVRGYVSYLYSTTDKWKGDGVQRQQQVNAKLIVPLGNLQLDAWYSFSRRTEADYQDLSMEMINRLGSNWDNLGSRGYAQAINLADIGNNRGETGLPISDITAGTTYPGNIRSVDDAYYDAAGVRRDNLAYLGLSGPIGDEGKFLLRGYYHNNKGQGLWGTPYVPSPNDVPLSMRATEYDINRGGVFGSVTLPIAGTEFTGGGWYEKNRFDHARRFYAFDSRTNPGRNFREFQSDPFLTQWQYEFTTETLQYFVQDKIDLGQVKVNLGWKGFRVTNESKAIVPDVLAAGTIRAEDWFQPHIGFAAELSRSAELFGGYTEATRAFASASTVGPFSTTQVGFDAIRSTLRPETSKTYEVGLRFNDRRFNGVLAAYYVDFQNRQLALTSGPGVVGNPVVLQNVGAVRSLGIEAAADVKLGSGFGLYASYAYNDASYRDDVLGAAGLVITATEGKAVVDSPKHIARGELSYESGNLYARVGGNYMSRRYYSYENDVSVSGRFLVDATLGWRVVDGVEFQLNATNLFDKDYIGTIGTNGYAASGDSQTLMIGAPRQIFGTVKLTY